MLISGQIKLLKKISEEKCVEVNLKDDMPTSEPVYTEYENSGSNAMI